MTIPKNKKAPLTQGRLQLQRSVSASLCKGSWREAPGGLFLCTPKPPFRAYKKAPFFKKGSLFYENQASILRMSRKSVPFISSMSTGWCSMMQE